MPTTNKFITFILGAGASYEVQMPTGNDLKTEIVSNLEFKADNFGRLTGGNDQVREALYRFGQGLDRVESFNKYYAATQLICAGMPQAPSIDNFIDSHRANHHIATMGKLAIAAAILKAERGSSIYVNPDNVYNTIAFGRVSDTWFNQFFQLISLNAQEDELVDRLSRVRVVTFNYDRTLEHFLFFSIQNYYGTTPARAAEILSSLVVLHPYGQVGALPWQQSGVAVPFGGQLNSSALIQVAKTLRTFTEGTSQQESQIDQIRAAVFDAEILTFLGFAFHELNIKLLFSEASEHLVRHEKQVFGTAWGLSESNKKSIAHDIARLGRYNIEQVTLRRELTAAKLLPEYSRTLRVPDADYYLLSAKV